MPTRKNPRTTNEEDVDRDTMWESEGQEGETRQGNRSDTDRHDSDDMSTHKTKQPQQHPKKK